MTGATVTIEDDDSRGVVVNPMALTMEEGGEQSYTMLLTSAPSETTYMAITVPANADLRVSPSGFYFHSGNWNVAQTVRVISLGDTDVLDDTVVLTHAFSGGDYNGIAVDDVSVTITEQTSTAMSVEDVRGTEGSGVAGVRGDPRSGDQRDGDGSVPDRGNGREQRGHREIRGRLHGYERDADVYPRARRARLCR